MSWRPRNTGRARLNEENETLSSICAALALELALVNPRAKSLRNLPLVVRDATMLKARVALDRTPWYRKWWWGFLRLTLK